MRRPFLHRLRKTLNVLRFWPFGASAPAAARPRAHRPLRLEPLEGREAPGRATEELLAVVFGLSLADPVGMSLSLFGAAPEAASGTLLVAAEGPPRPLDAELSRPLLPSRDVQPAVLADRNDAPVRAPLAGEGQAIAGAGWDRPWEGLDDIFGMMGQPARPFQPASPPWEDLSPPAHRASGEAAGAMPAEGGLAAPVPGPAVPVGETAIDPGLWQLAVQDNATSPGPDMADQVFAGGAEAGPVAAPAARLRPLWDDIPTATASPGARPKQDIGEPAVTPTLAQGALRSFGSRLTFEDNRGQAGEGVRFVSAGGAARVALSATGAELGLGPNTSVEMSFVGADLGAVSSGEGPAVAISNYFTGAGPHDWLLDVPSYSSIAVRGLYHGVDLAWYADASNRPEYDLRLAPGADLGQVAIHFAGAERVAIGEGGKLLVELGGAVHTQQAPVAYQVRDGRRELVDAAFALRPDGSVGFDVGAYDRSLELVIDPVLGYPSPLSLGADLPTSVVSDAAGYLYVAGTHPGEFGAPGDIFLRKIAPDGATVFTNYYGGSDTEAGARVALAGSTLVVAGTTDSLDAPTLNAAQATSGGGTDGFVAVFNPTTGALVRATYLGGSGDESVGGVGVDGTGSVWVGGNTNGAFPTTTGATTPAGGRDLFLTRYDTTGAVATSALFGGTGDDTAAALAMTPSGKAVVAGQTTSTDLPVTGNAFARRFGGGSSDGLVAQFAGDGSTVFAGYLGGADADRLTGVASDNDGAIYVTGASASADFPTVNPLRATKTGVAGGTEDAVVSKLDPTGSGLVYSTWVTGAAASVAMSIGVDAQGQATLVGTNGLETLNPLPSPAGTENGLYLSRLAADGMTAIYSTPLGGSGLDGVAALDVSASGVVTLAGSAAGTMGEEGRIAQVLPTLGEAATPRITGLAADGGWSSHDGVTTQASPTLVGIAAPGALVRVMKGNGTIVATATADSSGNWSAVVTQPLAGTTALTASKVAPWGVNNLPAPAFFVTVDTTAPSVSIDAATTTRTRPQAVVRATDLNGLPDGTIVTLSAGAATLTAMLRDGQATFELPEQAAGSSVTVTAVVSDRAGNIGQASASIAITAVAQPWQMTAQSLSYDPESGDGLAQVGNVQESYALDLDRSPGTTVGHDPALVYNSERVAPRPIVQATLRADNAGALPTLVRARLFWDGVDQGETTFAASAIRPGRDFTLALRPGAAVTQTGRHAWSIEVTLDFASGPSLTQSASGTTYVVTSADSIFGEGWSLSIADRLYAIAADANGPAGVLRAFGTGGWRFYTDLGGGAFASPAEEAAVLTRAADGTYTITDPEGRRATFDASGRATALISTDGHEVLTFSYNPSGQLGSITAPDGATTQLMYAGPRVMMLMGGGGMTMLSYSGASLGSASRGMIQHTWSYADGQLTRATRGTVSERTWGYTNGVVSSLRRGTGADLTLWQPAAAVGLGALGHEVEAREEGPWARTTVTVYDDRGRALREEAADGSVTRWVRDTAGRVVQESDALGRSTGYTRDAQGYVTLVSLPNTKTRRYVYAGPRHELVSETNEAELTTLYTYDGAGHLVTMTNPMNETTTRTWANGLLVAVTDPLQHTTTFGYDAARRRTSVTDPLLQTTSYTYDSATGELASRTDRRGFSETWAYDSSGRLATHTDRGGNQTTYQYVAGTDVLASALGPAIGGTRTWSYDTRGLVTSVLGETEQPHQYVLDRAGQAIAEEWDYKRRHRQFDGLGQVVVDTNGVGAQLVHGYDAAGQATALRDPLGRWTFTAYDPVARVVAVTDAAGRHTLTRYTPTGQVYETEAPGGLVRRFGYDDAGRLRTVTDAPGTPLARVETTEYDDAGRVTARIDVRQVRTEYDYDEADRLVWQAEAVGTAEERETWFEVDEEGNVIQSENALGQVTVYAYDGRGLRTSKTEGAASPTTRTWVYAHDMFGRLTSTTDPLGRVDTVAYDAYGRPTSVAEASGTQDMRTTAWQYAAVIVKVRDDQQALEQHSFYTSDAAGRLVSLREPSTGALEPERTTTYVYDLMGNLVLELGPRPGATIYHARDELDRITRTERLIDSATGEVQRTKTSYDLAGNVASTTDPLERITTYAHDALNRRTDVFEPLGRQTHFDHDPADHITRVVDPLGRVTETLYDPLRRVKTVTQAKGTAVERSVTNTYNAADNVTAVSLPGNLSETYTYDELNRKLTSNDPVEGAKTYTTDLLGRTLTVTDAEGSVTAFGYDGLGRQNRVEQAAQLAPSLRTVRLTDYDLDDRVSTVTIGTTTVATYGHNRWGNLVGKTDSEGTFVYQYDQGGALTHVDNNSLGTAYVETDFTVDLLGRRLTATDVFNRTTTFSYDEADQLLSIVDRNGRRRQFVHDALGRVTQETWFDPLNVPVGTITSTRDLADQLRTISNSTGTVSRDYDALGRVTREIDALGITRTTTWRPDDNPLSVTDTVAGTETNGFGAAGEWTSQDVVTSALPVTAMHTYRGNGQPERTTIVGVGLARELDYDAANRVNGITVWMPTHPIETLSYTYDPSTGMVAQESRQAWRTPTDSSLVPAGSPTVSQFTTTTPLTYDTQGQLTGFGGQGFNYAHGDLQANGLLYGLGHRLLEDTLWTYSFDYEGNLTAKQKKDGTLRWEYAYDHHNRLTRAEYLATVSVFGFPAGQLAGLIEYHYDGLGRRIKRYADFAASFPGYDTAAQGWLRYHYDGERLIADLDGDNALLRRYVFGPDGERIARVDAVGAGAPRVSYYVTDKDGLTLDLVDGQGAALVRVKQGAYKAEDLWTAWAGLSSGWIQDLNGQWVAVSHNNPTAGQMDRWLYGGREQDHATGLGYAGLRWYDPEIGRFISEDFNAAMSANGYRYPKNSPRNVKVVERQARDWVEAATWYYAARADFLTGGLSKRFRKSAGLDDVVKEDSTAYRYGGYVSQAHLILMGRFNPTAGAKALNLVSATGHALTAAEMAQRGDYAGAARAMAGSALSLVRGMSPCRWALKAVGWAQRGLHAQSVALNVRDAYEKYERGEYIGAILDLAQASLDARRFMQACFCARTKLLTKRGWVAIEEIAIGDEVWSKPEGEPTHPGRWKRVEETFVRPGWRLNVHVRGEVIGTSAEHPFYVVGKGWVEAAALQPGDELVSRTGVVSRVEEVYDTGAVETLYNLRVADWHTYFVGDETWAFDVWAHNACNPYTDFVKRNKGAINASRAPGETFNQAASRQWKLLASSISTSWPDHEVKVTARLKTLYPGRAIGQQVSVRVTNPADGTTRPGRLDNLVHAPSGNYLIVDAKYSKVKNLADPSVNLNSTVTKGQKVNYPLIASGAVTEVTPFGKNASAMGLVPGVPITVESRVEIHVNGPTGIEIRNY